jgi:hypothetical protein
MEQRSMQNIQQVISILFVFLSVQPLLHKSEMLIIKVVMDVRVPYVLYFRVF